MIEEMCAPLLTEDLLYQDDDDEDANDEDDDDDDEVEEAERSDNSIKNEREKLL